ncbi:MAG: hypothetical protein OP8BY_2446 [Candidatus Saccharicenans subterraneus]|uniref:Uncharacterized protein n=1 Tax=Candidatus Saccharicenans subterraneus TaxID=2508984 RepID=A0A3E2BJA2_9BACT|nr:MAG: hypothetical protein OP8BY_2446 [Candidatus Saccharicenans subterraneum]
MKNHGPKDVKEPAADDREKGGPVRTKAVNRRDLVDNSATGE